MYLLLTIDGLMATVYWYYRPEDVDQVTATYFHDVSYIYNDVSFSFLL